MSVLCKNEVVFGEQQIEEYWNHLATKGLSYSTMKAYQNALMTFYEYLPGDKTLNEDALLQWEANLKNRGYADKTIKAQRTIVNGFLEFLTQRNNLQGEATELQRSILTRDKYLWLLRTAQENGWRRAYLLIKTVVIVGIRTSELEDLTVEALREGGAWVTSHGIRRRVLIPEPVRSELLHYAKACDVTTGTLFVTKDGTPLLHSAVWKEIKRVCRATGLENDAGNPRSLYLLYVDTYQGICRRCSSEEAWQEYEQLLSKEETLVAWNDGF